ncbi:hypothetical protein Sjap_016346 [Stephania japonica]|uniref:Uncharacterized protein n=1 Tax=Stephania japonica TaxID=461633 RepID=A0AAP0NTD9_9MAGN
MLFTGSRGNMIPVARVIFSCLADPGTSKSKGNESCGHGSSDDVSSDVTRIVLLAGEGRGSRDGLGNWGPAGPAAGPGPIAGLSAVGPSVAGATSGVGAGGDDAFGGGESLFGGEESSSSSSDGGGAGVESGDSLSEGVGAVAFFLPPEGAGAGGDVELDDLGAGVVELDLGGDGSGAEELDLPPDGGEAVGGDDEFDVEFFELGAGANVGVGDEEGLWDGDSVPFLAAEAKPIIAIDMIKSAKALRAILSTMYVFDPNSDSFDELFYHIALVLLRSLLLLSRYQADCGKCFALPFGESFCGNQQPVTNGSIDDPKDMLQTCEARPKRIVKKPNWTRDYKM